MHKKTHLLFQQKRNFSSFCKGEKSQTKEKTSDTLFLSEVWMVAMGDKCLTDGEVLCMYAASEEQLLCGAVNKIYI